MKLKLTLSISVFLALTCCQSPDGAGNKYGLETISSTEEYHELVQQDSSQLFVDLSAVLDSALFDIRYATDNNFTGEVIYPSAEAWARRPVAEALKQVEDSLLSLGFGLVIYDAYRPYAATVKFYEVYGDTNYVASPYSGSRHNRGCAIDLGLYDRETGELLKMPTEYDNFTEEAHQATVSQDRDAEANKIMLREIMVYHGFDVYPYEWWHYDYQNWKDFPLMNLSFNQLSSESRMSSQSTSGQ